jgi:hypothetical protein
MGSPKVTTLEALPPSRDELLPRAETRGFQRDRRQWSLIAAWNWLELDHREALALWRIFEEFVDFVNHR